MASYDEYLAALNKLDNKQFKEFTGYFQNFKFKERKKYALFLSVRKQYDTMASKLLNIKSEAERKNDAKDEYYDRIAHKILKKPYIDKKPAPYSRYTKQKLPAPENLSWRKVLLSKRPLIIYGIAFAVGVVIMVVRLMLM